MIVNMLGMPMIVTGGICNYNMTSSAKDSARPENQTPGAGIRIVEVEALPSVSAVDDNKSRDEIPLARDTEANVHVVGFKHRYEVL